jgi:hypothetical protein
MANTISALLSCAMLRVRNTLGGTESEPFEEARTFASITYEIADLSKARQAPGTPILGIQRVGRGEATSYVLFRNKSLVTFAHDTDDSLLAAQWIFKVQFKRGGANRGVATVAYPVIVRDFDNGTLNTISWKMLLKTEKQGRKNTQWLFYVQPQGGGSAGPCQTIDCNNPQTAEELSICLVNKC